MITQIIKCGDKLVHDDGTVGTVEYIQTHPIIKSITIFKVKTDKGLKTFTNLDSYILNQNKQL